MKIDVIMPKMGESLQEGTILKWLKKEGEHVDRDEMILEISTDKVDTEVPAPAAGILTKIFAAENEVVEVGKKIAEIETEATTAEPMPAVEEKKSEPIAQTQPEPAIEEKIPEPAVAQPAPEKTTQTVSGNFVDVIMPKMGESLQEGTILKWLKKTGDIVERDEMILEISTDKVDTEVPSPVGGTLTEILANEGDTIEVGKVIARISTGAATKATAQAEAKSETVPVATASQAGKADQPVAVQGGTKEIPRNDGDRFYSPLVRAIAESENIPLEELQTVKGTGTDGRISKSDIMDYISKRKKSGPAIKETQTTTKAAPQQEITEPRIQVAQATPAPQTTSASQYVPPSAAGAQDEIIPMDRVRQLIAEHMVYSKRTSAHVTSVAECDATSLVKFRENHKNEFEKREGFKLTYTPFFGKAIIDALKVFPRVNVSVDEKNIIMHKRINLSIATALENGNLIVPVIKNSDSLSLSGLARAIFDLSTRARTKKLNPDDIQGGTITLTNVGTFGTMFGTPVINQPQCAIIGVGAIKKQPVVRELNGEDVIVIRNIMYVSITYDHRVIDGMLAGQTLAQIVKNIEAMDEKTLTL